MKFASVIVDVPARQTDRPFDYIIPNKWEDIVQTGMRVVVPFGPRKLQGFIIDIKDSVDVEIKKLKSLHEILDVTPVLNEELLKLGFWLTEETLCYTISAFQVMLPTAIKATYKKLLQLHNPNEVSAEIDHLFQGKDRIDWEEVASQPQLYRMVQKEITNGTVEVIYKVKDKVQKKKQRVVQPELQEEGLEAAAFELKSKKQQDILYYFMENYHTVPLKVLKEELQITDAPIKSLVKKGLLSEKYIEVYRNPYDEDDFEKTKPFPLTDEQKQVITPILSAITNETYKSFLLYGVTGSGKTEVYLQSIAAVLEKGKEAIVLVPEIALTPQMVERFKGRFGSQVAVLHSALSVGEKYDEWRKILRKEVKVVVGARSAIFAPFENLGIIIIDEEHEASYKQEDNPRYHARDVAIWRGRYHCCPIVLGSATPTLESFARAKKGVYELLTMEKRMNEQALPTVNIIDMREELRDGNRSMFSRTLHEKIADRLKKKEQMVLFLNRRGHSTFVMCRDCGYVVQCPHCDISLTYHKMNYRLKCHYCSYEEQMPTACPACNSSHIRFFGTGTQKVEEELTKLFPEARVIRMDVDTTSRKGMHEKLLKAFGEEKADILLGTQMIAKGLDFPKVTLVGVLTADTMLHLPDFRASEKTYQLLTQVSGRAGRHDLPGEVVIQTYTPEHYSIELAKGQNYDLFFEQEMQMRRMRQYPPYYYVALVTVSHPELLKAVQVTEKIVGYLRANCSRQTMVLGPVASPIPRIKDRYRYQCMIKYKREPNLKYVLKMVNEHYQAEMQKDLQISIDFNPTVLM
ncbi:MULTISPECIES: primosomal protein N' [Bacillus cereus group]|uniref:Replication restart protein PriA n=1 Tax=Bacillus cytotoxicus (strain DSM 22905 / CIP 110041 / 391-98 / NVH 391-98) TaxID=315749 RepID=A7GRJ8_BACCN|nr:MULTISPECIES: primosomal protein N' [Bacillus cereus group]ABS22756.1 primosomal protein N' [Bacillus cytotoxicus NVH 391-98]AWC29421.1 primosomal protein N' [Bacillus cytotoxicus]AWC41550.1 primosomal protein N' [Bacillus cytotoxicus]AWC49481.1 primosomal protein N' [Bacillus cytotoxicus]AWC53495.1 primosomal protein N' [Bacillus cytotoxicus]